MSGNVSRNKMEIFKFNKKCWTLLNLYTNNNNQNYVGVFNFISLWIGEIGFIFFSALYLFDHFTDKIRLDIRLFLYVLMQIALRLPKFGTLSWLFWKKENIQSMTDGFHELLNERKLKNFKLTYEK